MKKVAVLGSTGSIGTQTLDVIRKNSDKLKVHSLVAYSNIQKLAGQVEEFAPQYSALISVDGEKCLLEAVKGCDVAVVATRGITALDCIIYCLDNGIDVALANKETLVCAGELVMSKVGKARIYPIDSEHCAINQCLLGRDSSKVSKIMLTASGGPFWNTEVEQLPFITAQDALKHPNWNMGAKITIDSATMMNKSLEVIEASWLFGVPVDAIQIVVHRQSVVHSMVEYLDGSVIAQMAAPDMRLPIQIALLGENTFNDTLKHVNFEDLLTLTFEKCDFDKFPCARLGYEIKKYPPLCATIMNAANDVCVERFLQGKFSFAQFYNIILKAVDEFATAASQTDLTIEGIKKFERDTKLYVENLIDGDIC